MLPSYFLYTYNTINLIHFSTNLGNACNKWNKGFIPSKIDHVMSDLILFIETIKLVVFVVLMFATVETRSFEPVRVLILR